MRYQYHPIKDWEKWIRI